MRRIYESNGGARNSGLSGAMKFSKMFSRLFSRLFSSDFFLEKRLEFVFEVKKLLVWTFR
jgi:hypothetical protein